MAERMRYQRALLDYGEAYVPGGTPLYEPFRYVQPQRVWFFTRFGHKQSIDLAILPPFKS